MVVFVGCYTALWGQGSRVPACSVGKLDLREGTKGLKKKNSKTGGSKQAGENDYYIYYENRRSRIEEFPCMI